DPFGEDERGLLGKKVGQSQGLRAAAGTLEWIGRKFRNQVRGDHPAAAEQSGQKQTTPEYFPASHVTAPNGRVKRGEHRSRIAAFEIAFKWSGVEPEAFAIHNDGVGDLTVHGNSQLLDWMMIFGLANS